MAGQIPQHLLAPGLAPPRQLGQGRAVSGLCRVLRGGGDRGGCVPDALAGGHPIPSSRTPSQPGWPLPGEHALHECSVRSCSQGCWVRAMLPHSLMDMSRRSETCYYQHCTLLTLGKELAQEWSSGADKGSHEGVIWYASVQCGGIS